VPDWIVERTASHTTAMTARSSQIDWLGFMARTAKLATTATHWKTIFSLPDMFAEKSLPLCSINDLSAVTSISRATTSTAIHDAIPDRGSAAKKIKLPQMMILSTKGSKMRPSLVT
jgi:hypothetical protein